MIKEGWESLKQPLPVFYKAGDKGVIFLGTPFERNEIKERVLFETFNQAYQRYLTEYDQVPKETNIILNKSEDGETKRYEVLMKEDTEKEVIRDE